MLIPMLTLMMMMSPQLAQSPKSKETGLMALGYATTAMRVDGAQSCPFDSYPFHWFYSFWNIWHLHRVFKGSTPDSNWLESGSLD
jgi:hypothetical protein